MCLVTVINFIGNQIITYIPIIYLYDSSGEVINHTWLLESINFKM